MADNCYFLGNLTSVLNSDLLIKKALSCNSAKVNHYIEKNFSQIDLDNLTKKQFAFLSKYDSFWDKLNDGEIARLRKYDFFEEVVGNNIEIFIKFLSKINDVYIRDVNELKRLSKHLECDLSTKYDAVKLWLVNKLSFKLLTKEKVKYLLNKYTIPSLTEEHLQKIVDYLDSEIYSSLTPETKIELQKKIPFLNLDFSERESNEIICDNTIFKVKRDKSGNNLFIKVTDKKAIIENIEFKPYRIYIFWNGIDSIYLENGNIYSTLDIPAVKSLNNIDMWYDIDKTTIVGINNIIDISYLKRFLDDC